MSSRLVLGHALTMGRSVVTALAACALVAGVAGCGSSGTKKQPPRAAPSATTVLRSCLHRHGYSVSPEPAEKRRTAPARFEFSAVWNVLNPNRIALAMTISRTTGGAQRAAVWTRHLNAKIGKGVVKAPVVRFGRIDVLWTAEPGPADTSAVYGCVRASS